MMLDRARSTLLAGNAMLFRQVIHEDLGCASYLVGDVDEETAAVIDPQWDIEPYLHLARLYGVRIEHVLETHTHADHVSGHGRLAGATGATIHVNRLAEADYPHEPIDDGWVLRLGSVSIEAVHTPGHRPEHTAFLLRDTESGDPAAVLTGDSLFVGEAARPDLAVEAEEGARDLYRSLRERLFSLPPEVEVWPGHLGGSLCGGSDLDHRTSSTIGFELVHNRAAAFDRSDDFVEMALATLADRPPNVEHVVELNRGPLVTDLGAPVPLSPREVAIAVDEGATVVDVRTNAEFDEAHVPGAISVSAVDTGFGTKVAQVSGPGEEVVVVGAADGGERTAGGMLASVGLRVRGYLDGGMTAWHADDRPVGRLELIGAEELGRRLDRGDELLVLDVRSPREYAEGHIPGSLLIPYGELGSRLAEIPGDQTIAPICSGGKRSGLVASVLLREGFDEVVHVGHGGVQSWARDGRPLETGSPSPAQA